MDQCEAGLAVSHPSYPFGTLVARFKQSCGWLGAVYFGLTGSSYIYLVKLLAI